VQDDREAMLSYSFKVSLSLIQNRKFRRTVHESLVKLYNEIGVPDLISVCQVTSSSSVSSLSDRCEVLPTRACSHAKDTADVLRDEGCYFRDNDEGQIFLNVAAAVCVL